MTAVSTTGPAPYIYSSTRMRVRQSKLLVREDYLRMLNMSLPEITRFIEEMEYKAEIDELGHSFSGTDLIEVALSWNLAKEYQNVIEIMPGVMKGFCTSYLGHWDIYNVLTILRGKSQGASEGRIKEVLIPAGSLDRVILDRILGEDSPERIADQLEGWKLWPVLQRELPDAVESNSYAHLENELFKAYYFDLLRQTKAGVKGGKPFREYLRLEIDLTNINTVFRSFKGGSDADVRELMIEGGSFSPDELARMAASASPDEIIDAIKKKYPSGLLTEVFEGDGSGEIHEIENSLTRVMLDMMDRISKRYPFSICSTLIYLRKKRYEVANLRALARGKAAGLASERISEYLVV